jgi:predicted Zn-dependent protease
MLPKLRSALGRAVLTLVLLACASESLAAKPSEKRSTVLLTERDEEVVGRKAAAQAVAEFGLFDDPALAAYVDGIGRKLLRGFPHRSFRFHVVDDASPNAFAIPGGYVFVSRGLLALANSEDELACVIGHEIAHVLARHAATQQALDRSTSPLVGGWRRAAQSASYSRDMERQADTEGQRLCAAAGYDPRALSTYLQTLRRVEPLIARVSPSPGFFATHPNSVERAAAASVRASELRWRRDPARGDGRAALLARIDGMPVGQRPQSGVFRGDWFLQPDMNFQVRFPSGWRTSNTSVSVGAKEPKGAAVVFLTAEPPTVDGREGAERWLVQARAEHEIDVVESKRVSAGTIPAWRLLVETRDKRGSLSSYVTAIPYAAYTFLVTGVAPSRTARKELPRTLVTARTFGPLSDEARASIRITTLEVVTARAGETPRAVAQRTRGAWDGSDVAVYNGVQDDFRFAAGDRVKIARERPYASKAR